MTNRLLVLALFSTAATACILPQQGPKSGVVATGDKVAVVDDIKTWTTHEKEKVAETEYTDSDGKVVGKGAVYADKETVHHQKIWYGVQGNEQLADEDFFKITGDQASLDRTLAMRADGKKWQKRGLYTMIGGGVGAIAGFLIPNAILKTGLTTLGGLTVAGGYYMSYYGASEMNPETHAVDRSVADRAANNYNASLGGRTVGLSFGKKF